MTLDSFLPLAEFASALLLAGGLAYVLKPMLQGLGLNPDLVAVVFSVAEKVVMAVEQAHGHLGGVDKKRLATEIVTDVLSHYRVQAPRALVDAAIESAVLVLDRLQRAAS